MHKIMLSKLWVGLVALPEMSHDREIIVESKKGARHTHAQIHAVVCAGQWCYKCVSKSWLGLIHRY